MDASATISVQRQDAKVLGLISTGHFMSHFYGLTLQIPPGRAGSQAAACEPGGVMAR